MAIELPKQAVNLVHPLAAPKLYIMSERDYHADPAPDASLTQSIAKILLNQSPLHAWFSHPRLNPEFTMDDATKYDVGNVAHTLMLGKGREIVAIDFNDWRTNAAKEARELARQAGKLAVLQRHYELAEKMVTIARERLRAASFPPFQTDSPDQLSEVVCAWREETIWLRCMIDSLHVAPRALYIDDYKTTDMSASPDSLDRMMVTMGWDIQAAMAERALLAIDPQLEGMTFRFVVQEANEPFAVVIYVLTESILTMGRKKLDMAIDLWRKSMQSGKWPGYPLTVYGEYPAWAEASWLNREVKEKLTL